MHNKLKNKVMFYTNLVILIQLFYITSSFSIFRYSLSNNLSIHDRVKASIQLNKSHRATIEALSHLILTLLKLASKI